MLRTISLISLCICFSCSPSRKLVKQSSIFANLNDLGTTKHDFLSRFGNPFSTEIKRENRKLIESLYYIEIINQIAIVTKFTFVNEILIEQSNNQMTFESQEVKKLKKRLRGERLRNFTESQ